MAEAESKQMHASRSRLETLVEELRLAEGTITIADREGRILLADDIAAVVNAYLVLLRCVQIDPNAPYDPEASFLEHTPCVDT